MGDYAEREGYMKGLVKKIIHDNGCGAPCCEVVFHDPYRFKLQKKLWVAVEGLHTGQFVYCGSKAQLAIGNAMPLGKMPEGTVISMVREGVRSWTNCSGRRLLLHDHWALRRWQKDQDSLAVRVPKNSTIHMPWCYRYCSRQAV